MGIGFCKLEKIAGAVKCAKQDLMSLHWATREKEYLISVIISNIWIKLAGGQDRSFLKDGKVGSITEGAGDFPWFFWGDYFDTIRRGNF